MRRAVVSLSASLLACAGQAPLASVPALPNPRAEAIREEPLTPRSAMTPTTAGVVPSPDRGEPVSSLPVSLGDIGERGEVRVLAASAGGAWVALCTSGAKNPSLVLGSGVGEPIEDVLAYDSRGRYLVVQQDGAARLVDAVSGTRVNLSELGADIRRVRADYAEHRSLSFDASGRWLAYLRRQSKTPDIVVRELESGAERSFALGSGEAFRLWFSADSRYVELEALREDSNKNGKLDWPAPEDGAVPAPCAAPSLPKFRSFSYQGRGDQLTRAVLTLADGSLRDVPDLVTPLGPSLLVREGDGSLRLEEKGKRTDLAPASCAGRVLFADAERGLVLAACSPPPPKVSSSKRAVVPSGKRQVWLFGRGFAKDLQSELYETATDREASIGERLVPVYPGSSSGLVDLERRELLPLPGGSRVLATRDSVALLWRDSDLYRYDAQSRVEQPLAQGVLKNPDLLRTGSSVLLSPFVVVGLEAPAWPSPALPLALSADGFVLTASGLAESSAPGKDHVFRGPLHWVDARLPPPDGPPR